MVKFSVINYSVVRTIGIPKVYFIKNKEPVNSELGAILREAKIVKWDKDYEKNFEIIILNSNKFISFMITLKDDKISETTIHNIVLKLYYYLYSYNFKIVHLTEIGSNIVPKIDLKCKILNIFFEEGVYFHFIENVNWL